MPATVCLLSLTSSATGIRARSRLGCRIPTSRSQTCLSNARDHAWRPLLEQKDNFQPPFHTEDPEREWNLVTYRINTWATTSVVCRTWTFKQNVSKDSASARLSQPYHCFTRTQCLSSHHPKLLCVCVRRCNC